MKGHKSGIFFRFAGKSYFVVIVLLLLNLVNLSLVSASSGFPEIIDFGTRYAGTPSLSKAFYFTNETGGPIQVQSFTFEGDTNEFILDTEGCANKVLEADEHCTLSAVFLPLNAGVRSALLTLDYGSGTAEYELTGFGLGLISTPPTIGPGSLTYPPQLVGTTSASQQITITNTDRFGGFPLGLDISGDFAQTNDCGGGLGPNESCTITVTFTPTAVGPRTGSILIDYSIGTTSVSLSGTGFVNNTTKVPTTGDIRGKVTLNGSPLSNSNVKVTLNGTQPQNPDPNGNFGYNELLPGNYTVTLTYDPNLYAVAGQTTNSVKVNNVNTLANATVSVSTTVKIAQISIVNFNLQPVTQATTTPAPTTTTSAPTTTASATVTTAAPTTTFTGSSTTTPPPPTTTVKVPAKLPSTGDKAQDTGGNEAGIILSALAIAVLLGSAIILRVNTRRHSR